MGQCLETNSNFARIHPFLGPIEETKLQGKPVYRVKALLLNEEDYVEWAKNVKRLQIASDIKDLLYLPIHQKLVQGGRMCEASDFLQLILPTFNQSLQQTLMKYKEKGQYFSQPFLWYLLLILNKYGLYQESRGLPFAVTFHNVLVWQDGGIKVVPRQLMPHQDALTLTIPSQTDLNSPKKHQSLSTEEVIGMLMLTLSDLLNPSLAHDLLTDSWKRLTTTVREDALRNCQKRYSSLFVQTLKQLTGDGKSNLNLFQLSKRLELFQSQITSKREGGAMKNSSAESFKASMMLERTNLNASSALMLSNLREDSGVRMSHAESKFMNQSDKKDRKRESFSIL